ncbi:MAG TPA: hypothetical protein P5531_03860 [Bacteroidales bacterium]|nr:hypothetical protein [Bacteroidales bacterium]
MKTREEILQKLTAAKAKHNEYHNVWNTFGKTFEHYGGSLKKVPQYNFNLGLIAALEWILKECDIVNQTENETPVCPICGSTTHDITDKNCPDFNPSSYYTDLR